MIPVYDACGRGLGDLWATINHYTRMGAVAGKPIHMSRHVRSNGVGGADPWSDDKQQMLEIIDCLDLPYQYTPIIVDDEPTVGSGMNMWAKPYFPTKVRWDGGGKHTVGYQFDGISCAEDKNPTAPEIEQFIAWARSSGTHAVKLGKPLSLEKCIYLLASSDLFVGACSGLSHVAISVGLPVHLLEYKVKVYGWYMLDRVHIHQGMDAFIRRGSMLPTQR